MVLQKFMKNSRKLHYKVFSRVKLQRLSNALVPQTVSQIILKIKHQVLKELLEYLCAIYCSKWLPSFYFRLMAVSGS